MTARSKLIISILCVVVGICLLAYPWISEYIYENQVNSIVNAYEVQTQEMDVDKKTGILSLARQYNERLMQSKVSLTDPFSSEMGTINEQFLNYLSILSLDDYGLMASLEIPKISVYLPIYHGTSSDVLQRGVGHLENTSFPVGGENTHAVLSAHTGLNTAKLFTDLVELEEEDLFFIHVLGDTLAYKVCNVDVVEPSDTEKLTIQKGKDLVTLITCTPYGINSHRLLVTGARTDYTERTYNSELENNAAFDSLWMQAYKEAVLIGISMILFFVLILLNVKGITNA